jgi:hypothetical protein
VNHRKAIIRISVSYSGAVKLTSYEVHAFSCTNLVIQNLLLSQWEFSCSKYLLLSQQKPRDVCVVSIHIIVNHIGNNFNIILPSTAQFNMWPLYMRFLTYDPSWTLILASTSIFCKEKILLLCIVTSYDYTDIYHDNEHLILTYCTVSEIHSTCTF